MLYYLTLLALLTKECIIMCGYKVLGAVQLFILNNNLLLYVHIHINVTKVMLHFVDAAYVRI